jgi:hypothetical protein
MAIMMVVIIIEAGMESIHKEDLDFGMWTQVYP